MADFGDTRGAESGRIVVVENWIEDVKRRLPVP
jgi:hypothetical protein